MGWPEGVLEGSGWGKSKGVHWRTYERLCEEHDTFEDVVNRSFIARFGPMLKKGGLIGVKMARNRNVNFTPWIGSFPLFCKELKSERR